MQRLEVSGAVRLIYKSLGVKGLNSGRNVKFTVGCAVCRRMLDMATGVGSGYRLI